MTQEDKILLTARYVEGDMNSSEQYEYELRLEHEPDLNEHLRDYQEIHENFRLHLPMGASRESFFPPERGTEKHYGVEEPDVLPIKSILEWFLGIAAVIIAVFIVWAPWNVNLYRTYAYFEKIPLPKNFVGDTISMQKAVYLYNGGSYLLASHLLGAQHAKNPMSAELSYAYGNTLVETAHLDEARTLLESVAKGNSNLKYFADYSMALSYVREDNSAEAKVWLEKIPKTSETYPVAAELSRKL